MRPFGSPKRRWEDNIRMDLEGINAGNSVDSAQDRDYWRALVNCGIEPPGSISHGVKYSVHKNVFYINRMKTRSGKSF